MMIGLPKYPYMVLSSHLVKTFTTSEIEYVVLHEAGHYVLAHSAKLAALFVSFIIFGSIVVTDIPIPLIWIPTAVLIGLIMIQASRLCEYEADAFALHYITNPKGMISATQKFEKAYQNFGPVRHDEDTLLGRLIYMGIPYNARIRSAKREMEKRK
jgi:Zn-dependent protease with chaperone function